MSGTVRTCWRGVALALSLLCVPLAANHGNYSHPKPGPDPTSSVSNSTGTANLQVQGDFQREEWPDRKRLHGKRQGAVPAEVKHLCTEAYRNSTLLAALEGGMPPLMEKEVSAPQGANGPHQCHPKAIDTFTDMLELRRKSFYSTMPCDLYRRIQGRTLWVVGDSIAQNWYKSLRSFLSDFWVDENVFQEEFEADRSYLQRQFLKRVFQAPGVPLRAHGGQMPLCTSLIGKTRVCHIRMNVMRQFTEKFLPHLALFAIDRDDIMAFNMGIWHKREGAWTKGDQDFDAYRGDYEAQVQQFVAYYKTNMAALPHMVWKDTVPQHREFWQKEKKQVVWPYVCKPLNVDIDSQGQLSGAAKDVVAGGWQNAISRPYMKALGLPYVDTWNETAVLHFMHAKLGDDSYDCTHFCFPGPRSLWTWKLIEALRDHSIL